MEVLGDAAGDSKDNFCDNVMFFWLIDDVMMWCCSSMM